MFSEHASSAMCTRNFSARFKQMSGLYCTGPGRFDWEVYEL